MNSMGKHNYLVMEKNHMEKLYNSKNPFVRFLHKGRLNAIAASIPDKNNLKILDAGCGEGHLLEMLHEKNKSYRLFGADITDIALKQAKKRASAKITKQDLAGMNYKNNAFDVVICTEVLEHIHDYRKTISELKRVARKNAILIITFPNEFNLTIMRLFFGRKPVKTPDHVNSFNYGKIKKEFNLPLLKQFNLPVNLPFQLSMVGVCIFKNKS